MEKQLKTIRKRKIMTFLVVTGLVLWGATSAMADDIHPPPWADSSNSTVAIWETGDDGLELGDFVYFEDQYPLHQDIADGPFLEIIEDGDDFNTYRFFMPNFIDPLPVKKMRVQVTYFGDTVSIAGIEAFDPDGMQEIRKLDHVEDTAYTVDASYFYEDWELYPNPDYEFVLIDVPYDSTLHQVVIDTVSTVPVPGAVWLLGSGLVGFIGLKRKPRKHSGDPAC